MFGLKKPINKPVKLAQRVLVPGDRQAEPGERNRQLRRLISVLHPFVHLAVYGREGNGAGFKDPADLHITSTGKNHGR